MLSFRLVADNSSPSAGGANSGHIKRAPSKQGQCDDNLPSNRTWDVQRAFWARRASHLEALKACVVILIANWCRGATVTLECTWAERQKCGVRAYFGCTRSATDLYVYYVFYMHNICYFDYVCSSNEGMKQEWQCVKVNNKRWGSMRKAQWERQVMMSAQSAFSLINGRRGNGRWWAIRKWYWSIYMGGDEQWCLKAIRKVDVSRPK